MGFCEKGDHLIENEIIELLISNLKIQLDPWTQNGIDMAGSLTSRQDAPRLTQISLFYCVSQSRLFASTVERDE